MRKPDAPATSAAAADTTTKSAAKSAAAKLPSVADIQAAVILAAKAPAEGLGVDEWGFLVNQALAPFGKAAPDPMPLFTAMFNAVNQATGQGQRFDRAMLVTAPAYWAVMGPALKAQTGLAGYGMYGWVQ